MEITSGIVIDVGHGIATCVAVWNGKEYPGSKSCDPLECTAAVVAQMVHSVVSSCSKTFQPFLRERVVVTGKRENSSLEISLYLQ